MTISLSDAGKRYNRDWIFRHLNYQFEPGKSYAITGPNGSGKSTLLQVISGAIGLNEGTMRYMEGDTSASMATDNSHQQVAPEFFFRHIAICAPYLELVEEMTLNEFLLFHQQFKPFRSQVSVNSIAAAVNLERATHKQIRDYSSGMKQRVKLAQAIFSDVPVILLDEPCTNLDADGVALYHGLIRDYCADRLVIVSSNDPTEYEFCGEQLSITTWK